MTHTFYFVRMRGKILGPFSVEQLRDQRDRGYFSVVHEVSTDRRNWTSARSLPELFPPPPIPGPDELWFYVSPGGERTGPISGSAIRDMVVQGHLSSTTLVWKKGLSEWQTLAQAGLAPHRQRRGWRLGWRFRFLQKTQPTQVPDSNLPDALDDPMLALRSFLGWAIVVQLIVVFASCAGTCALLGLETAFIGLSAAFGALILGLLPYTLAVRRILPKRAVDLLYLRSFKYDPQTAVIRYDIHKVLGRRLRVSGIRDPKRRWPRFIRFAFLFAFALRYSTPRYLNLEAGDDWKVRLWRSLTLAKGALIDVSDMTPFVVAEMRLCYGNMGLNRVVFIGDGSKPTDKWRELINTTLGRPASAPGVQFVIWEENRGDRRTFQEALEGFAAGIPETAAGCQGTANELQSLPDELQEMARMRPPKLWVEILIGIAIGVLLTITHSGLSLMARYFSALGYIASIGSIAMAAITLWHMCLYLKDCGSHRERILTVGTFGSAVILPFAFAVGILSPAVQKVQDAAYRASSSNNLRQIALAMFNYADEFGHLPSANTSIRDGIPDVGQPAVSWRVKLLPYLIDSNDAQEQAKIGFILRNYRTDEPWNSVHNRQFIELMPKVYRLPARNNNAPPGSTHYRVFVTPRGVQGPSAIFLDGLPGAHMRTIVDGASNTILAVEAAEPVFWTDPTELVFTDTGTLPKLGGHFHGVYHVALADGSVRTYRENMPDSELRARITENGGEAVHDD